MTFTEAQKCITIRERDMAFPQTIVTCGNLSYIQSNLDISDSDISNWTKLEETICLKNIL